MPQEEDLGRWYRDKYRQEYKRSSRPHRRHVLRAARLARERYAWMLGAVPPETWASRKGLCEALDIGCSGGEFLHLLESVGVSALGIEPHQGYAFHARDTLGLKVLCGTLAESLPMLQDRRFDLLTMFHVLEHLTQPRQTLEALQRLLHDDGLLYLEVPNAAKIGAPNNMFFRAHTLYFAKPCLVALVQAAGYAVVADQFERNENLRLLLRKSVALPSPWHFDDDLIKAQQRRRWLPYLWSSLLGGRVGKRLAARLEEKQSASRFASDSDLLQATYRGLSEPGSKGR